MSTNTHIIKICIDAGHGGKDPGAVYGDWLEKEFTLDIALKLKKKLKRYKQIITIMTRETDEFISLSTRCFVANQNKCDLFISIHINSASNSTACGIETHIYSKNENLTGQIFQEKLIEATQTINRGVKISPMLYVLNSTKMSSVLLELGFINNFNDIKNLRKETYRDNLATAIEKAICRYFNIEVLKENNKERVKMIYKTVNEIPEYAKSIIKDLVDSGVINGEENGNLNLSDEMVRTIIITKRMIDKSVINH